MHGRWLSVVGIEYYYVDSEIRTNLSYGHPLIPRCPDKRGLTVPYNTYVWRDIYLAFASLS